MRFSCNNIIVKHINLCIYLFTFGTFFPLKKVPRDIIITTVDKNAVGLIRF